MLKRKESGPSDDGCLLFRKEFFVLSLCFITDKRSSELGVRVGNPITLGRDGYDFKICYRSELRFLPRFLCFLQEHGRIQAHYGAFLLKKEGEI